MTVIIGILVVVIVVFLGVIGWLIAVYNGLVTVKNQTLNAFKQIDVQLKRRYDLIPNLVNSVKGAMSFEQDTLTKVIEARSAAVTANASGNVAQMAKNESALTGALTKLFALSEKYPELQSNVHVAELMEELRTTENKIAFARQLYNDMATKFNTKQELFPTNIIAGMLGFKKSDLFELATGSNERENVNVDLSLK